MKDGDARKRAWIPFDWAHAFRMQGEIEESIKAVRDFSSRVYAMRSSHAIDQVQMFAQELVTLGYGDVQVVKEWNDELCELELLSSLK